METPKKSEHLGIVKSIGSANEFLIYRLDLLEGQETKVFFLNTRQLFNNVEVVGEAR